MDQHDRQEARLPDGWGEALDRAEADIAAGRVVSSEHIMRRLRDALAAMEARATPDTGIIEPR
jgi:hypothetical protein